MAKKTSKKNSARKGATLASLDRLVRSGFQRVDRGFAQVDKRFLQVDKRFEQVDKRFEGSEHRLEFEVSDLKRQITEQGVALEQRIDRLADHVDGFMKLHETLDIEFKMIKEQMSRLEDRLTRLEAARL